MGSGTVYAPARQLSQHGWALWPLSPFGRGCRGWHM